MGNATTLSIPRLRAELRGRVIEPDDPGYDEARAVVFNGAIDRRPAAIVRVADATDVARVIALARETGTELAVRSGGHSAAGHGVSEGGIVLDLADMKALDIDAEGRTAWAETGLTAGEYTAAADAHGLATGFGDTGSVGHRRDHAGRRHRLPRPQARPDHRRSARGRGRDRRRRAPSTSTPSRTPTCSGRSGAAAATSASRPGSGSACTSSTRSSAACSCCRRRPRSIVSFLAEAAAAPEELSTIANVMPAPPMPFVPAEHHGRLIVLGDAGVRGRDRGRTAGDRALPGARNADRRPGPADALSRDVPARRRGLPSGRGGPHDVRRRRGPRGRGGDRRSHRVLERARWP